MTDSLEEGVTVTPENENIIAYDNNGVSLFYNDESVARSMMSRRLAKARPLKLGTLEDLALVDVSSDLYHDTNSPDFALKEYIRTTYGERETPIYIFDDHNHALFAWFEALREGKIQKGATLYHFDDHSDGKKIEIDLPPETLDRIAGLAKVIDHDEFIDPAIKMDLIKDVFWIMRVFHERKEEAEDKYEVANSQIGSTELLVLLEKEPIETEKTIVDIDVDYFSYITPDSDLEKREIDNIRKMVKKAGVVTFAISPGFINSDRAIEIIKQILSGE